MKWREREKLEVDWDGRLYISNDVFVKFLYESVKKKDITLVLLMYGLMKFNCSTTIFINNDFRNRIRNENMFLIYYAIQQIWLGLKINLVLATLLIVYV